MRTARDHGRAMDRIYRYQRHFYDATRPLFLPGRDALLAALAPRAGERVLEMGCGTARNLIRLARRSEGARFFGIDVSREMLLTAARSARRSHGGDRICLRQGAAEALDPSADFSPPGKFDRIFFSYSLTMMPAWREALDAARAALNPGGGIYAVDFWDAGLWPQAMRSLFFRWLRLFEVRADSAMPDEIRRRFPDTDITPLWGRYAFLARPAS